MRKIVNEIWVLENFDAIKLAKYTRCLFQATLPLDDTLAMRLLDEACDKARELREVGHTCPISAPLFRTFSARICVILTIPTEPSTLA